MDTALAVGLVEMFHVNIHAAKRGRPRALLVKSIEKETIAIKSPTTNLPISEEE